MERGPGRRGSSWQRTGKQAASPSALACAAGFQPEVVLCDIGLPGIDGFEMARRLRQEPGLSIQKLVVVSGHGQLSDH